MTLDLTLPGTIVGIIKADFSTLDNKRSSSYPEAMSYPLRLQTLIEIACKSYICLSTLQNS
jgi:hypothetical protein